MSKIKWKKEFSVGIKKLDNQHKKIIKILNQLLIIGPPQHEKGGNEKEIEEILDNLHGYIREHFRTEEEYMLKYNYPGYDKQKEEHNNFIDRLCEFEKEHLKGHRLVTINIFNFVWDWFSQHILKLDKQYSPFLKEKI